MEKLLDVALWILVPIAVILTICGTALVFALFLYLIFGIPLPGLSN